MMNFDAAIIAGGAASRYDGVDKPLLTTAGETFLERLGRELAPAANRFLALDRPGRYRLDGWREVVDPLPGRGPLAGIVAALREARSEWLLVVAADMPRFRRPLAEFLFGYCRPDVLAVTAMDRSGREHPLSAFYNRRALPVLEQALLDGRLRLRDLLDDLTTIPASLRHTVFPDDILANINTPDDYAALIRPDADGPPIIAVCGVKNSGKTTFLERVIPPLVASGIRVGVLKHDGHDFSPDVPGTDSYRLRLAGAEAVGVYSRYRYLLTREWDEARWGELLPAFAGVDVILLEGGKTNSYPKIEVLPRGGGKTVASDPETLLAVVSETDPEIPGTPFLQRDDAGAAARFLAKALRHIRRSGVS
ncbi:MAG: molybdopterin-guanine dinucleotide biosynthesis protein B [Planctomycetes bacterium]|nr:molybdopterin-guanine dinucleotide biosynthesis protein B [Planctomycetota bacterium]